MRVLAWWVVLVGVAACGPVDPCAGQAGGCLAIDVQGEVAAIDSLSFHLSGAVSHDFVRALPNDHKNLPIAIAVLLPASARGTIQVEADALSATSVRAAGMAKIDVTPGTHTRLALRLTAYAASCANGALDPGESDVDCGGSCAPCADGLRCGAAADCTSGVCTAAICSAPSCLDGVMNQKESDIDCGGPCDPCDAGKSCLSASDCKSLVCTSNRCVAQPNMPAIVAISPSMGSSTGGIPITITGMNFVAGALLQVQFDGVLAANPVVSPNGTTLTVTLPAKAGAHGPAKVTLTNGDGQVAIDTTHFAWYAGHLDLATGETFATDPLEGASSTVDLVDVNGDGHLDVVSNVYSPAGAWGIQLGNGDGSFQPFQKISLTPIVNPRTAVADLDGDKIADVLVMSMDGGYVDLWKGKGDGTFTNAVRLSGLSGPVAVAVGDFDGTNGVDIAVAELYTSEIKVFLSTGALSFDAGTPYALAHAAEDIAVGHLNNDAHTDLVVAHYDRNAGPTLYKGGVAVLLGVGNGTFGAVSDFPTDDGATVVRVADFNKDGYDDVVVSTYFSNVAGLDVLFADSGGTGSLSATPQQLVGIAQSLGLSVADLDGDGLLDIAADIYNGAYLGVFKGTANGQFGAPSTWANYYGAFGITSGDVDQDGKRDLVIADPARGGISVIRGLGMQGFINAPSYPCFAGPVALLAGDFTGDGYPDLVVAGGSDIEVLPDSSTGAFLAPKVHTGAIPRGFGLAAAQLDADMNLDLVAAGNTNGDLRSFIGVGDATFTDGPAQTSGFGAAGGLALALLNADAILDAAVPNYAPAGGVVVALGLGAGAFGGPVSLPTGPYPTIALAARMDAGTSTDLVVVHNTGVDVLLGVGNGTFGPATTWAMGASPTLGIIGDFNNDGAPDLAVTEQGAHLIWVRLNKADGTGGFQTAKSYPAGTQPAAIVTLDLDLDGVLDLAVADAHDNAVHVFRGKGDGSFEARRTYAVGSQPSNLAVGDFNKDGLPDLAVLDQVDARVAILFNSSR